MMQPNQSVFAVAILCAVAIGDVTVDSRNHARHSYHRTQESEQITLVAIVQAAELNEISGMARSLELPGGFWVHNDSSDEPKLYLLNKRGIAVAHFQLAGATNRDWEDICGFELDDQRRFLIVADVGDNGAVRDSGQLYLFREPQFSEKSIAISSPTSKQTETENEPIEVNSLVDKLVRIDFCYEDGPRDCEAIGFDKSSRFIYLFEKVNDVTASTAEPGIYRLDVGDYLGNPKSQSNGRLIAQRIASLPIRDVTGMDFSPDSRRLVVRTYRRGYLFERREDETWPQRFARDVPKAFELPIELQGEAICFETDAESIFTTSEFRYQPIWQQSITGYALQSHAAVEEITKAQDEIKKLVLPGEAFEFDGHAAFILWPPKELRKEPQAWVFYAPTLPPYPDEHERWMHEQFLAAGVGVAGIDVGEAYGSPESRKVFDAFYDELVSKRKFSAHPCLLGRSRGGLWVANWAADHPERFAGLAGIYPVFDFRTYPGLAKTAPAYGLTDVELATRIDEFNPISRAKILAAARLPVFLIHGDQDTVVPLAENSAAMSSIYEAAGAKDSLKLIVAPGQGHNMWDGFFRSQELVDFVVARAIDGANERIKSDR